MNMVITKQLNVGMILALLLAVTACGGSSDKIIDNTHKDKHADISFINGLDSSVAFHIKTRLLNRDVFDDKQKAVDVPRHGRSDYRFRWISASKERSQIGVINSYDSSQSLKLNLEIKHKGNYWTIAWQSGDGYRLAVFNKSSSDEAGRFSVRVFSNTVQEVSVNDSVVASTVEGQVIGPFSIVDCAAGLAVGGNVIDLCNEVVYGESYLAVVDAGGKLIVVPEQ